MLVFANTIVEFLFSNPIPHGNDRNTKFYSIHKSICYVLLECMSLLQQVHSILLSRNVNIFSFHMCNNHRSIHNHMNKIERQSSCKLKTSPELKDND